MKTVFYFMACIAMCVLSGCGSMNQSEQQIEPDASWQAYCSAYGVDADAPTLEQENYFLDCWCGSVEEENALNNK